MKGLEADVEMVVIVAALACVNGDIIEVWLVCIFCRAVARQWGRLLTCSDFCIHHCKISADLGCLTQALSSVLLSKALIFQKLPKTLC